MEKKSIAKNYAFLAVMLGAMILGAIQIGRAHV